MVFVGRGFSRDIKKLEDMKLSRKPIGSGFLPSKRRHCVAPSARR
jgi:hypothetical protein